MIWYKRKFVTFLFDSEPQVVCSVVKTNFSMNLLNVHACYMVGLRFITPNTDSQNIRALTYPLT